MSLKGKAILSVIVLLLPPVCLVVQGVMIMGFCGFSSRPNFTCTTGIPLLFVVQVMCIVLAIIIGTLVIRGKKIRYVVLAYAILLVSFPAAYYSKDIAQFFGTEIFGGGLYNQYLLERDCRTKGMSERGFCN